MKQRRRKLLAADAHIAGGHWQSCSWISDDQPLVVRTMPDGSSWIEGPNERWGTVWSGWSDEQCRHACPLFMGLRHAGAMIRGEMRVSR